MNADSNVRRPLRRCILALLACFGCCLSTSAPVSRSYADDTCPAVLRLTSGGSLQGRLIEASDRQLLWESELFAEPVRFRTSAVSTVQFRRQQITPGGSDEFRFTMLNGDTLFGTPTAADAESVSLRSNRLGALNVARHSVAAIRRVSHGGLVYLGPSGFSGWASRGGRSLRERWFEEPDGGLKSSVAEATLTRRFKPLKRISIEIELRFDKRPEFTLSLGKSEDNSIRLETWDDTLVALKGFDFREVQILTPETRSVHVHIYVDIDAGRMLVYGSGGRWLAQFDELRFSRPPTVLTLRNGNDSTTLQHLRIDRWNGSAVNSLAADETGIRRLDGRVIRGKVEALQDGWLQIATNSDTVEVPIDQVSEFVLTPARTAATIRQADHGYVRWSDGEQLSGEVVQIDEQHVILRTDWAATSVRARAAGINRIDFPNAAVGETEPDQLSVGDRLLRGRLVVDEGDSPILWKPTGAMEGVELRSGGDAVIVRSEASQAVHVDSTAYPDVIYLMNDDLLPCRLDTVSETHLQLTSPFIDAKQILTAEIKAVELSSSRYGQNRGFADEQWNHVRGRTKKTKDQAAIISGAFGHPNAMTGNWIRFRMQWPKNQFLILTVHLFADQLRRPRTSTQVTFLLNENSLWIQDEQFDPRNPFFAMQNRQAMIQVAGNDVQFRLEARDGRLYVFVNDKQAEDFSLNPHGAGNSGILFEVPNGSGGGMGFAAGGVMLRGNVRAKRSGGAVRHLTLSELRADSGPGVSVRQFIEEESRRHALTIPRFRREDPPTHVLIAPNGDLLRGRLAAVHPGEIEFESRLEVFRFPRERVAAIVWLRNPENEGPKVQNTSGLQTLLAGGFVVSFTPESLAEGFLAGTSASLGTCRVPAAAISELYLGATEQRRRRAAWARWQLQHALEPDWNVTASDGGNSAGADLVGQPAPDFVVPRLNGTTFRLHEQKGRIVVLDFWASWCGPCVLALPDYAQAAGEFDEAELMFLAVNLEESPQQVRGFLMDKDLDINVALDAGSRVASTYQVNGIPHSVVIGPAGIVEHVQVGYNPDAGEELRRIAEQILAETRERDGSGNVRER